MNQGKVNELSFGVSFEAIIRLSNYDSWWARPRQVAEAGLYSLRSPGR